MKKYIFMAVAGMLALSSCSNDDNEQTTENAPRQMTFSAGYGDDATTRATMDFSTKKVSFDANDEISILSAKNANAQFTTSAGGASATFTGTASDDSKFYAVYPYTAGLALSGTTITGIVIPTDQWNDEWAVEATPPREISAWDPKAPIAYATTTGSSLQFHNLCAILKIDLPGGGSCYTLTISANENLAGTFSLDTSTTPATLTATEGSKSITVGSGSNTIICNGDRHVYVAIAPGTYNSFRIVADSNFDLDDFERTKASAVTFEAGKIYSMGK